MSDPVIKLDDRNFRIGSTFHGPGDDKGGFVATGGSYLDENGDRVHWGEPEPESGVPTGVVTEVDGEAGTITIEALVWPELACLEPGEK